MPTIEAMFDDTIRFRVTFEQKEKVAALARNRHLATADILRELIDALPEPTIAPTKKVRARKAA